MRRSADLIVSAAVTGLAVVLAFVAPDVWWLRTFVGLPVVTLLPGYAVVASFDPEERSGRAARLAASVAASLAMVVLLGLLLALARVPLEPATWLAVIGGSVLLGDVVAAYRRRASATGAPVGALLVPATLVMGLLAFGLAGITNDASAGPSTGAILQLWALPAPGSPDGSLRVGVANTVSGADRFLLRVTQGDQLLVDTVVHVGQGRTWELTVTPSDDVTAGVPVDAILSSYDELRPLRQVRVWTGR